MNLQKKVLLFISIWSMAAVFLFSHQTAGASTTPAPVKVTFDANGGDTIAETKELTVGGTYGKLPVPKRKNYTFKGWYTFKNNGTKVTDASTVKIKTSHTLYARWLGNEKTITLNAGGGKVSSNKVTVYFGSKYENLLPTPTRDNYTFDGWYTAAKAGDKIAKSDVFDESSKTKLYAHWKIKTLKINFITYNDDTYEKEVQVGKKYGKLPAPKKTGHVFGGWYTWDDYSNSDAEAVTASTVAKKAGELNLFARWYLKEEKSE
ncbi:hypothetical protein acsn021_37040 [Anaerocolumna cellulosilytica]|uniref:Uncharacterized protein n=1 Tax=Anaerocolumna cellulosilytica TaxID=433286 RepID=A0A6S6RAM9_9FIRM|nr:InlB B-repeat-containing protein [Anaerocolumna cellulosilytica]MBB5195028.1 putative repeat protein (TIGR02543 family) [Anaerocolumna cellulosilytica]BCJ96135.1 hypothetical protein acsn021_37040 [Anaerocolumna cellulosilytica]